MYFNRDLYVELVDINGKGIKLEARTQDRKEGFNISFSVNKDNEKEPNESSITIYNLDTETRKKLDEDYVFVLLYGGYYGDVKLLSLGDIVKVSTKIENADIYTVINFNDGSRKYTESKINKTYPSGTTYIKILTDIASYMGYPNPSLNDISLNKKINCSQTISGNCNKYLKEYCSRLGVKFSIQNNKLIIKKEDTPTSNIAYVVSQDTGLVGNIEKTIYKQHKKYTKTKKNKKITPKSLEVESKRKAKFEQKESGKEHTIDFKMLLTPEIEPGSYLKIESKFINTYAIVDNLTHNGSNFEEPYYTEIKALIL